MHISSVKKEENNYQTIKSLTESLKERLKLNSRNFIKNA